MGVVLCWNSCKKKIKEGTGCFKFCWKLVIKMACPHARLATMLLLFVCFNHAEDCRRRRRNLQRGNSRGMKTNVGDLHVCKVNCVKCKKTGE